jgi:hypothetical protein
MEIIKLFASKNFPQLNEFLFSACKSGNKEVVEYIIEMGANNWNGA